MDAYSTKIADLLTKGITENWSSYNARPCALAAMVTLDKADYVIVPAKLTPAMIVAACDHIQKDGTGFTEAWAAAIAAAKA